MIQTKFFELRDKGTCVPVFAILMAPTGDKAADALLRRAGYSLTSTPLVLFGSMMGDRKAEYDPFNWGDRTFSTGHHWAAEHFDQMKSGDVIDVEFILGETAAVKLSELEPA